MIIAGVAIAAAAGALLAAWQISRPAELPQASCGQAVTHDLDASTQIRGVAASGEAGPRCCDCCRDPASGRPRGKLCRIVAR
jgi:hypothetical protein